jgi:hypothetical protein
MSTGHLDGEFEEMMGVIAIKQSSIEIALSCNSDRVLIRSISGLLPSPAGNL